MKKPSSVCARRSGCRECGNHRPVERPEAGMTNDRCPPSKGFLRVPVVCTTPRSDHRFTGRGRKSSQSSDTHLNSYLDRLFSSHAVLPPPKFFLAVLAIPCRGGGTGSMVHCEPHQPLPSAAAPDPPPAHLVELVHQRPAPLAHCRLPGGHSRGRRQQQQ